MKQVLIVENEKIILSFLSNILKRLGHSVAETKSGSEALVILEDKEFDAIFLDIHLPDVSGKEIYQKLKERSPERARRIVFISGDLRNPKTASFVEETGNSCLEKPFTLGELKEFLKQFFEEKTPCG